MMLSRRAILAASVALWSCSTPRAPAAEGAARALAVLEMRAGGRLGVAIVDADRRLLAGYRANERFGMCSTFKMALAGLILREADLGRLNLDAVASAENGLTIRALAEAAVIMSDNAAANLLLARLGGPGGFTFRLRQIGDEVTRLDRMEPELNHVAPGDSRDTTTPVEMARTTLRLLNGAALSGSSRDLLLDWMRRTQTGVRRLRAGLPADWRAGDKTGTGVFDDIANKYNDVAIVFPPGRGPAAIAAYYEGAGPFATIRAADEAVLAEVGKLAAALLS